MRPGTVLLCACGICGFVVVLSLPLQAASDEEKRPLATRRSLPAPSLARDDYERGITLYLAGEYSQAIEVFRNYLRANPDHIATRQWIALAEGLLPQEATTKLAAPPALPQVLEPEAAPSPAPKSDEDLVAEIYRLKQELEESRQQTQKAIEQTKRALAIPSPSFQSYQDEGVRETMAQEIEVLHEENKKLLAELEALKNARLSAAPPAVSSAGSEALERQIAELTQSRDRLLEDLKLKEAELANTGLQNLKDHIAQKDRDLDVMIEKLRKAEEARQAAESKLADADKKSVKPGPSEGRPDGAGNLRVLLEESRAQSLRLVMDIQKERKLRQDLEARLSEAERLTSKRR